MAKFYSIAGQRWQTVQAAVLLAFADALVRFVPFSTWKRTLGVVEKDGALSSTGDEATDRIADARALARRVERAARRMPWQAKCLPKAVALQWQLRRAGIPSRLVIAIHRQERSGRHAYHAWIEIGGAMVIGECDRLQYAPVARFDQFGWRSMAS